MRELHMWKASVYFYVESSTQTTSQSRSQGAENAIWETHSGAVTAHILESPHLILARSLSEKKPSRLQKR
jgi:hypothetical protein